MISKQELRIWLAVFVLLAMVSVSVLAFAAAPRHRSPADTCKVCTPYHVWYPKYLRAVANLKGQ